MKAEETRTALVDALARLLETRSVAAISVRQVAAEAGVNHGLVHRYFGSKEGLVRETVRRFSERVHEGDPVNRGVSAASFRFLLENPQVARIVARHCLDGPDDLVDLAAPAPERLEEIVAPIRRALSGLGLAAEADPYVINALATAGLLGWIVFRPLLRSGFGVPEDADQQVARILDRVDALLAPFQQGADDPGGAP